MGIPSANEFEAIARANKEKERLRIESETRAREEQESVQRKLTDIQYNAWCVEIRGKIESDLTSGIEPRHPVPYAPYKLPPVLLTELEEKGYQVQIYDYGDRGPTDMWLTIKKK